MKKIVLMTLLAVSLVPFKSLAEESDPVDTSVSSTPAIVDVATSTLSIETTAADTTSSTDAVITTTTVEIASSTPAVIQTINLHIRYNENLFFDAPIELTSSTITVTDSANADHTIPAYSALGVITKADTTSDAFAISNLGYFSSFNSFLINCITIQTMTEPACYNWQYVVNDTYPFVGADAYFLQPNDDVYLYFGNQHRLTLPVSSIEANQSITATAETYQYKTNTYSPLSNVTVGATQPDPNNPWSPIVVTSTLTDSLGQANLMLTATGTYNFGIAEDYYYPTISFTVTEATVTTSTTATSTSTIDVTTTDNSSSGSNSGGGTGGSTNTNQNTSPTKNFDVSQAITFLSNQQNPTTGAIGSGTLYSDWSAIAFGSYGQNNSAKDLLIAYLKTDPNAGANATDLERRAMGLMALNINPYSGTKTDYIGAILKTYQNNQFGDAELINDDIFALFPLLKAGYTSSDIEIQNSVNFILSRQSATGAWESPDLTAATIQALSQVKDLPSVTTALTKAKQYLKTQVKSDGRIGDNAFSTSWAKQAISALGENETDWKLSSGATPSEYLANHQNSDGGMENTATPTNDRIWSTAYAIPAMMNKPWSATLVSFSKPTIQTPVNNPVIGTPAITNPIVVTATSTVTSTLPAVALPLSIVTTTINITTTTPVATPEIVLPTVTITAPVENNVLVSPILTTSNTKPITKSQTNKLIVAGNQNDAPSQLNSADSSQPTLSAVDPQSSTASNTAKGLFGGAAAVAGTLGAYLAWRFVQGLV